MVVSFGIVTLNVWIFLPDSVNYDTFIFLKVLYYKLEGCGLET
jgi:hypothetical protein